MEYMVAEVLELAGNAVAGNKRTRITPRHTMIAVKNDEELKELLKGVQMSEGGVMPNIEEASLPRDSGEKTPIAESGTGAEH